MIVMTYFLLEYLSEYFFNLLPKCWDKISYNIESFIVFLGNYITKPVFDITSQATLVLTLSYIVHVLGTICAYYLKYRSFCIFNIGL
jgi:hypothetical protein